jgi:hypothetical protein
MKINDVIESFNRVMDEERVKRGLEKGDILFIIRFIIRN